MIKTHKIKLNPKIEQLNYFMKAAGVARFAWNWALDEYKRRKEAGEEIDWNDIKKQFRARIDAEFSFVREVTKCAAEQAIDDLRQSIMTNFPLPIRPSKCPGWVKSIWLKSFVFKAR